MTREVISDHLLARAAQVGRDAICITDADLDAPGPRILYINEAFTEITGYRADEVLGRNPRFLQGALSDRTVLDRLRADLLAGRSFEGETSNYRKGGVPFRMAWRVAPVTDDTGTVTHFIASQRDVTELRDAEELLREDGSNLQDDSDWLAALVSLSVVLARVASPGGVLDEVVATALGPLQSDAVALIRDDREHGDWVRIRVGGAFDDAGPTRWAPRAGSLIEQAIERRTPVFRASTDEPIGAGLGVVAGASAVLPIGSPSNVSGEPSDALVLTWAGPRVLRPSTRTHLGLLAQLITLSHRKTRALEDQRSLSSTLQEALLPTIGDLPNLQIATQYVAANDAAVVGGDWFDVVSLPGDRIALFVGDVVGHGAEAAALMGEIRFTIRGLLRAYGDPATLFDELDAALLDVHQPGRALATIFGGVLDPDGTLRYCNAGHPAPVICRADGSTDVLNAASYRLVGASVSDTPRATTETRMEHDDTLLAFSDGVFEDREHDYDESYGALIARLGADTCSPLDLCARALGSLADGTRSHRDDIVVLAARRDAPGPV